MPLVNVKEVNGTMQKKLGIIFIIILCIIVPISFTFIQWQLKPAKYIDAVILDKTVPDATYREHKGLMWILNNLKIYDIKTKRPFNYSKDYYGFFPLSSEKYNINELPDSLGKPDIIYITDTYGVYTDDFYKVNQNGTRSKLIYGGTTPEEIDKIKASLGNNVIIGEFNTLASPTDSTTRSKMEDIFGLKWTGWIGRYFSDLSYNNNEIPTWMKNNYELQYEEKWSFKGKGIVLVNTSDRVIVLRKDIELGKDMNKIIFNNKSLKELKVKNAVDYYYWFEITTPNTGSDVLANYKLDTTEVGKKVLSQYSLPSEFPAVVATNGKYKSYYFAGDFADSNSTPKLYNNSALYNLNRISTLNEDTNQNYFYWNVYYPMIKSIFSNLTKTSK